MKIIKWKGIREKAKWFKKTKERMKNIKWKQIGRKQKCFQERKEEKWEKKRRGNIKRQWIGGKGKHV